MSDNELYGLIRNIDSLLEKCKIFDGRLIDIEKIVKGDFSRDKGLFNNVSVISEKLEDLIKDVENKIIPDIEQLKKTLSESTLNINHKTDKITDTLSGISPKLLIYSEMDKRLSYLESFIDSFKNLPTKLALLVAFLTLLLNTFVQLILPFIKQ